jgi:hypothetical protein
MNPAQAEGVHNVSVDRSKAPVFVLTASRSGSTLLRFILDSHPELACPPETQIASACRSLAVSINVLENVINGRTTARGNQGLLTENVLSAVRETLERIYGAYLLRRGKKRWCDKSIDSFLYAELLAQIYPDAQFICLFRHCMDVVASGIEACPWGVTRYGFDPYVAKYPGNNVAAIANYWLDCNTAILKFANDNSIRCHRVRYEDLVTEPEEVSSKILSFLGASQVPGITAECFQTPHEGNGPGDEKIWFTSSISHSSIGRGISVPARALPPILVSNINPILAELKYRTIDESWNNTPNTVDPRVDYDNPAITPFEKRSVYTTNDLEEVVRAIELRVNTLSQESSRSVLDNWPTLQGRTIALQIENGGLHKEQVFLNFSESKISFARKTQSEHESMATIIAGSSAWKSLLEEKTNLITEITTGQLRCINTRDPYTVRSDEVHAVGTLLGISQVPLIQKR